jgi:chromosome segregation ATPase
MFNPWLVLGSIAFAASFSINLLMNRNWGSAIAAGLTGLAIAWGTAATVNWYRNHAIDSRIAALKHQVRALQHHRATEQQALLELEAEQDRVARSLAVMQGNLEARQTEMPSGREVSWNLMPTDAVESSLYPPEETAVSGSIKAAETELRQFLAEAATTKQKITASLNNLQTELNQLNAQTAENRQFRDQLVQEINHLSQQKQTIVANTQRLQADITDLEQCRAELDSYISYVETKKQELEAGANPLQKALQQLQTQVTALQTELQQLETQVSDRLHEKETLDQTIASLKQQHQQAQNRLQDTNPKDSILKPDPKKLADSPKAHSSKNKSRSEKTPQPASPNPANSASLHQPNDLLQPSKSDADDLSDPWTNFMVQLLGYEFQALRAIAQESNSLRTLNAIAEENFTNLDDLLESINRQAQDIIGESVVTTRSGFAPPAIARDYQKTIKKMIETYEYLTE